MLSNYLIALREGLEAGIVAGILIAALTKTGRRHLIPALWLGVAFAIAVSLGVGAALTWGPYGLSFQAKEILGGTLSVLSVALVTWMIFWMARNARTLKGDLEGRVAIAGGALGVAVLGFVSVAREGVETALFLWAAVSSNQDAGAAAWGAVLGLLTAAVLAVVLSFGFVRIDLGRFFAWTGWFLVIVAAGVLGYAVHDFQEAGLISGEGNALFDMSSLIPPTSWYGVVLAGIFNVAPDPSAARFAAWLGYLVVVGTLFGAQLLRRSAPRPVVVGVTG
ncbi:high-affinity Fe2+/Pb2+ permease [Rathayibacter sp. AY2B3]|uniref:iron uptake transporter permease EfeU n=1 Tax=unclassified Rathayibacter TaxID=2609250 RepID=UPI000CE836E7|nr:MULTISPECIES: iron uptake transporter permease EfeU [unclassified Rathayibacter]PPG51335.1 high-affinity Fe2+/Pb2+ permease [Rathayibacter sp. AY2B3]PPI21142.1 high-affinity Fe2+/Pb2+ permease [Rathayibacter sp. AY1B6]PPI27429.1 high-affinity Fe2+/Pb2+ permease [Rathayibacter sp. AY1B1]